MIPRICPVCNGTKIVEKTQEEKEYRYWETSTQRPCTNCGGQYMFGRATGLVSLDKSGNPCKHEYEMKSIMNGDRVYEYKYTCKNCGEIHSIYSN